MYINKDKECKKYKLKVFNARGHEETIEEIYVPFTPFEGYVINENGSCFRAKEGRMDGAIEVENVTLTRSEIIYIMDYLQIQERMLNIIRNKFRRQ